jgi:hypothetical protein
MEHFVSVLHHNCGCLYMKVIVSSGVEPFFLRVHAFALLFFFLSET